MTYDEILKRVLAGESTDAIAKEMTDMLNKATAEKKAQEAKKAEANAKNTKLNNIAKTLTAGLNEYAMIAGIKDVALETAEVRKILDEFLPVIEQFKDVKIHVAKAEPKKTVAKFKTADDVFNWFFKELGI